MKTERQKDMKIERQKDRKTERQKDRKTEIKQNGLGAECACVIIIFSILGEWHLADRVQRVLQIMIIKLFANT
jgi:hypothetical protein